MTYDTHARIAALVAAGFLTAAGGATAHADTVTSGNGSLLGGNQIVADLEAPLNVCGNAIAVLGLSGAQCTGSGATVDDHESNTATSGNGSVLGGNQLVADGDIPVNVCGNAIGVAGVAGAACTDSGASVDDGPDEPEKPENPDEPDEPKNPDEPEKPEKPGYDDPDEPGDDHPDEPDDDHPGYDNPGGGGDNPGGGGDNPGGGGDNPGDGGETPGDGGENPPTELAQTGTDRGALSGLLASAAAAIAAGAGLLLFGRRRGVRA